MKSNLLKICETIAPMAVIALTIVAEIASIALSIRFLGLLLGAH